MKHLFLKFRILPALAMICVFWSCTKTEPAAPLDTQQVATSDAVDALITNNVSTGTYKVTKFAEQGESQTSEFKGYTFDFQAGGVLRAKTNENKVVKGTWRLNEAQTRLRIDISGTDNLNDVEGDWKVVSITDTQIILRNDHPDHLVFTKI